MMKKLLTILTMVIFTLPLISQKADKDYLQEAPPIPPDACSLSSEEVDSLIARIERLGDAVSSAKALYKEEIEELMESNEDNVRANLYARSGLSQEEMEKLGSGKMTEAETMALANRMMQQQGSQSAVGFGQQNSARMIELTNSIQQLNDSLSNIETDFAYRFVEISEDQKIKSSRDSIEVWKNKLTSMMGIVSESEAKMMDGLAKKICNENKKLCAMYSSKYVVVLKEYQTYVKSSLKEYDRLERLNFELAGLQTGVSYPHKPGCAGYSAVLSYLDSFKEYTKFNSECTF